MRPAASIIKTKPVGIQLSTFLPKSMFCSGWGGFGESGGADWAEILQWNRGMSHTLSKSRLCVYIRDGCVKILLGWITNWPGGRRGGVFQHSHPPLLSSQFQHRNPAHAQQRPNPNPRPPPNPGARVSVSVRTQLWKRGRKLERSALLHQHLTKVIQH